MILNELSGVSASDLGNEAPGERLELST
jgi:hypothetical protein